MRNFKAVHLARFVESLWPEDPAKLPAIWPITLLSGSIFMPASNGKLAIDRYPSDTLGLQKR
jgi:hypothetical protein